MKKLKEPIGQAMVSIVTYENIHHMTLETLYWLLQGKLLSLFLTVSHKRVILKVFQILVVFHDKNNLMHHYNPCAKIISFGSKLEIWSPPSPLSFSQSRIMLVSRVEWKGRMSSIQNKIFALEVVSKTQGEGKRDDL